MSTSATIATVILGVSACTAFLAWGMWRTYRSAERAERDPKYRRRLLLAGAMLYIFAVVFGIFEVARGERPIQSLIGLPIPLLLIWYFLWLRAKVKTPRD